MDTLITRILPTVGLLLLATAIEFIVPLRKQSRVARDRLPTNLTLVSIAITLALLLNFLLIAGAAYLNQRGYGLLPTFGISGVAALVLSILILDGAAYAVHVLMHKQAWGWRFHIVHHIDRAVDATTALRQHPLEGLLRFSATAVAAWSLGATPEVIAIYRLMSVTNAIFEHANIRTPPWLDRALIWFWVMPNMHKFHHSRVRRETDSNYANLFSLYDRLFRTFTPSTGAASVNYGIEGYDAAEQQAVGALLRMPFRSQASRPLTISIRHPVAERGPSYTGRKMDPDLHRDDELGRLG
jgi:sterol desaturase/sphingolipid hydroxylase (fatty acid hydroxylase superfamily)